MKDLSICRFCGSKKIEWNKHFQCGEIMGWSYHYRVHCQECRKYYSVEHHPYPEKICETKNWKIGRESIKHILKMTEDKTLPIFNLPFQIDINQIIQENLTNIKSPVPPRLF